MKHSKYTAFVLWKKGMIVYKKIIHHNFIYQSFTNIPDMFIVITLPWQQENQFFVSEGMNSATQHHALLSLYENRVEIKCAFFVFFL